MPRPKTILLVALALLTALYILIWVLAGLGRLRSSPPPASDGRPTLRHLAIGFVTNFFDTLGIGSFAPTTALFRFWRVVPDERIPGTMNVGHTLPTIAQAFIFIAIVQVDFLTMVSLIAVSIAGAWLGAGVVAGLPRRQIQGGMGIALLVASALFLMTNLELLPGGGTALELTGAKLGFALAGNFVLGALMTLGIGLYAPCLIMLSLLGMNPIAVFPVMMGSCAFLMPVASIRFLRAGAYRLTPALGLTLAGVPAVLLAGLIVKSLPLTALRWLVLVVVLYAAIGLLRAAARGSAPAPTPAPAGPDPR